MAQVKIPAEFLLQILLLDDIQKKDSEPGFTSPPSLRSTKRSLDSTKTGLQLIIRINCYSTDGFIPRNENLRKSSRHDTCSKDGFTQNQIEKQTL